MQRQKLYEIYQKQEKKSNLAVKYEAKFNEVRAAALLCHRHH